MTTAIDSNVIVALWNQDEAQNLAAKKALGESQTQGRMVICGAVYAELMAAPGRTEQFIDRFCEEAGIAVEWEIGERVWRAAGAAFQGYAGRRRKQKGVEARRILADFLIGAHALVNAYKLLTLDARIYQASFPKLRIVTP
ncbi:MAG TPA: PIN domain-containing protein [Candidatus Angelobacter sp.]|nr:PIN domain-containing protein [Candidatus Angelobacter sp.]